MNADIKQPIYHIFRESQELASPPSLPLLTDCSVSAQFNASLHFWFCCWASPLRILPPKPPPPPLYAQHLPNGHTMRSILCTCCPLLAWVACVSSIFTLYQHRLCVWLPSEILRCSRSLHPPHTYTLACLCDHTIVLVFMYTGCLFVRESAGNGDVSCADSFSTILAWSVGQLVVHRLTPPILLELPYVLPAPVHSIGAHHRLKMYIFVMIHVTVFGPWTHVTCSLLQDWNRSDWSCSFNRVAIIHKIESINSFFHASKALSSLAVLQIPPYIV